MQAYRDAFARTRGEVVVAVKFCTGGGSTDDCGVHGAATGNGVVVGANERQHGIGGADGGSDGAHKPGGGVSGVGAVAAPLERNLSTDRRKSQGFEVVGEHHAAVVTDPAVGTIVAVGV